MKETSPIVSQKESHLFDGLNVNDELQISNIGNNIFINNDEEEEDEAKNNAKDQDAVLCINFGPMSEGLFIQNVDQSSSKQLTLDSSQNICNFISCLGLVGMIFTITGNFLM